VSWRRLGASSTGWAASRLPALDTNSRNQRVVDVSRTAHLVAGTRTTNLSRFRPKAGLGYVGIPLAARTSPWHSSIPTTRRRGPGGRLSNAARHPPAPVRPPVPLT
jgi:hypothetical protein